MAGAKTPPKAAGDTKPAADPKPAAEAKAAAKPDRKAVKTYIARTPIKALDGMVAEGEPIELTAAEARELLAIGAIADPDATVAED